VEYGLSRYQKSGVPTVNIRSFYICWRIQLLTVIITRHSLVREKGEVFVLLYVFLFVCFLFGQRFLDNPLADSRRSLHAGVGLLWFRVCLSPLGG